MEKHEELIYLNIKERCKAIVLGILLGLFVIIPGVSGATLLIIFGLYQKIIFSISHIFKKGYFKKCLLYLLPIILGLIIGLLLGLILVQKLLEVLPFSTILLFSGLLVGSLPILFNEIKDNKKTHSNYNYLILGFIIISSICFLSLYFSRGELFFNKQTNNKSLVGVEAYFYVISILIGFVIGITQVIPGLSASAFLMMIGYYSIILNSISFTVIKESPLILIIFALLIVGFLLGLLFTNKVMYYLYSKHKEKTNFFIVGLSLGSVLSIFISKEMFEKVYLIYFKSNLTTLQIVDMSLSLIAFGIGIFISLLISKKSKKINKQTTI